MLLARALVFTLTLGIFAAPPAADAEQAGKVRRIGYLSAPSRQSVEHVLQVFLRALRELGWVEGQNLVIEYRWADGKVERLPGLAADLVQREVDLIIAPATSAALAAKNAARSIPIVMIFTTDPVALGLVASLARPGANVTGTTITPTPEIFGKHLELLKEAVPHTSRVAVLLNPAEPAQALALVLREVEAAARSLDVGLRRVEARGPEEFDRAFAEMVQGRADALLVLGGGPFLVHRTRLAGLAMKYRLPAMYSLREYVEAGGLMSYAVNMTEFVGRAAVYVDKILKGAKPADLPVEQPTRFEFVINLKTAKALGLTIPQSVLIRADQVIR
jgi:putative ABC transport system substrate-binding protein